MDPLSDLLDIDIPLATTPRPRKPTGKLRKLLRPLGDDDYALEIDWSSLHKFQTCDRAGFYSLVRSRSTYEAPALIYGRAMHVALESWHVHGDLDAALITGETCLSASPPPEGEWRNLEAFQYAFRKYAAEYPMERFTLVEHNGLPLVERAFAVHLGEIAVNGVPGYPKSLLVTNTDDGDPFFIRNLVVMWTGVIDAVMEQNGEFWAIDHKTTSIGGPTYFQSFELSQQFIGYTWAASEILKQRLKGTLLNVIFSRKPTKTGKTVECSRRFYEYSDFKRLEWHNDIMTMCEDLIHRLTTSNFPKKTEWCVGKFGTCPYLNVCSADSEQERELILMSDQYAPNVWNPLDTATPVTA